MIYTSNKKNVEMGHVEECIKFERDEWIFIIYSFTSSKDIKKISEEGNVQKGP